MQQLAVLAIVLSEPGSGEQDELTQWMDQQRREVK